MAAAGVGAAASAVVRVAFGFFFSPCCAFVAYDRCSCSCAASCCALRTYCSLASSVSACHLCRILSDTFANDADGCARHTSERLAKSNWIKPGSIEGESKGTVEGRDEEDEELAVTGIEAPPDDAETAAEAGISARTAVGAAATAAVGSGCSGGAVKAASVALLGSCAEIAAVTVVAAAAAGALTFPFVASTTGGDSGLGVATDAASSALTARD